jgi:hypothetical protein
VPETFSIGGLAAVTGLPVETNRFYSDAWRPATGRCTATWRSSARLRPARSRQPCGGCTPCPG